MNINKLSDDDFFKLYCYSAMTLYDNGSEEIIYIKDKDFDIKFFSKAYTNHRSPNSIAYNEVVLKSTALGESLYADATRHYDELIKSSRIAQSYLYVDVYNSLFIHRERAIINPATDSFVGISGSMRPFMQPNVLNLIYRINNIEYRIANREQSDSLKYELTERQHMVLFFYVNKYSYSEIASILTDLGYTISAGRVNAHLENLKYIFGVKSKEQLIEKAISLKYHLFMLRKLVKPGFYTFSGESLNSNTKRTKV